MSELQEKVDSTASVLLALAEKITNKQPVAPTDNALDFTALDLAVKTIQDAVESGEAVVVETEPSVVDGGEGVADTNDVVSDSVSVS